MIPSFLLKKETSQNNIEQEGKKLPFVDRTIRNVSFVVSATFMQWRSARQRGFLQLLDGRTKVLFLFLYIILISLTVSIVFQLLIAFLLFGLFLLSGLNLLHIYKRILAIGFVFGFLIFLPASLNVFTKGEDILTVIHFPREHHWWIYTIPSNISITNEGIRTVARLTLKVINSVSLVLLIISTTTFERIVKSLSFFGIPHIFLLTFTLTYKFIFILSNTVVETYQAIKMRWWNRGVVKDAEEIVAGRIGYLFRKSWERYELVYKSMVARGFSGRVNFYYFDTIQVVDYLFMIVFVIVFSIILFINYSHARII
jgi:cobalt/nickel transport system permease protein